MPVEAQHYSGHNKYDSSSEIDMFWSDKRLQLFKVERLLTSFPPASAALESRSQDRWTFAPREFCLRSFIERS